MFALKLHTILFCFCNVQHLVPLRAISYVRHLLASVCRWDFDFFFFLWFLWHFGRISAFKFLWLLVIIWCENWLLRMLWKVAIFIYVLFYSHKFFDIVFLFFSYKNEDSNSYLPKKFLIILCFGWIAAWAWSATNLWYHLAYTLYAYCTAFLNELEFGIIRL